MMLRIAPKQKLNVLVFSALGFFLAFSLLVLFPKYRAVRKLILDVRAAAAENTALEKQILTSKKSGTRLEDIQKKLHELQSRVPDYEDLPHVLDVVASNAQAGGLKVISLQALDEQASAMQEPAAFQDGGVPIRFVTVALQSEGAFGDIGRYLETLGEMPFFSVLQSVMLKNPEIGSEDSSKEPSLATELRIEVPMRFQQTKV
ncbi:MAG: hypothetical protein A2Y02_02980 [Omnitrophica bacterium GWA2_52_12]|nr:MAG: hypothetical protein A2Y02_02980 [Omnitrophica bacterium GWA2_52_12]